MSVKDVSLDKVMDSMASDIVIMDLFHYNELVRMNFKNSNKISKIINDLYSIIGNSDKRMKSSIIRDLKDLVNYIEEVEVYEE